MRPVQQLATIARDLDGIFTDIDDTLTHAGALVPGAYAALCAAREAGLRVVAVTGRPAGWAEVLASTWPVDAVVAENGAFAVRRAGPHRALERDYFLAPDALAAEQARLAQLRAEIGAELPFARVAEDQWLRRCDLAFDIGETVALTSAEVALLHARLTQHGARVLASTIHMHASFGDQDKAKMAVRLGRRLWNEDLDARRERYLYVGDSPNDQAGFAHFPYSAAPSNIARYVSALAPPATFIAQKPGGHGFAEIVQVLLDARKR
jgi:HAD superfamily hydrolase (TIGR01484 family)